MPERVEALLRYLGHHSLAENICQLTLPELGALVVVAGNEAGFEVELELSCGPANRHKMDCAWYAPEVGPLARRLVVAWEFDGRDATNQHLLGDAHRLGTLMKLTDSNALIKIEALYTIRNEVLPNRQAARAQFQAAGIRVLSDEELMTGALLHIVGEAVLHLHE